MVHAGARFCRVSGNAHRAGMGLPPRRLPECATPGAAAGYEPYRGPHPALDTERRAAALTARLVLDRRNGAGLRAAPRVDPGTPAWYRSAALIEGYFPEWCLHPSPPSTALPYSSPAGPVRSARPLP